MKTLNESVFKDIKVRVIRGDLTQSDTDAIVNAANSNLQHGGGVAGAIVRRGGQIIQEESNMIGYVPVGHCVLTTGGSLKAKYVIHTVGPRWGEGDEEQKLRNAVKNTLILAAENKFKTISMPAISAGIFGFPKERCARIIIDEITKFAKSNGTSLKEINIYLMDDEIINFFEIELKRLEEGK
jgi:O-acetyl-ADP-ribose deacetylase